MKKIVIRYSMFFTLSVLFITSNICASEPKTLVQDILTNPNNRWKDLHLLSSQLIGSMILHNHPIVHFILNRVHNVVTSFKRDIPMTEGMAVNSSGDMFLSCFNCRTVQLCETSSGKCIHSLKGHKLAITAAAFNNSGNMIVTASQDGTAKLWETKNGKCLHTLRHNEWIILPAEFTSSGDKVFSPMSSENFYARQARQVRFAAFNSSGDILLTTHQDKTVKLWDTNSGECLQTLTLRTWADYFWSPKFNVSGDRVLTSFEDKTAKLWEISSGKCLQTLKGHTRLISSAVFNTSGDRILTVSHDNTAKLWDSNSGECLHTLKDHTRVIWSAVFNASGDRILTASNDGTAKLWDTNGGECLHTLKGLTGSKFWPAKFSSSGDMIVTASQDGTAKLWETSGGKCLHTLKGHADSISSAAFHPSGDLVVTSSHHAKVAKLWDTNSGKCLHTLCFGRVGAVGFAKFNGSGDTIIANGSYNAIHVYQDVYLFDIRRFLKLRSFFLRNDSISLNQAIVLLGIYEIIHMKQVLRKRKSSYRFYYRRLRNALKSLSSSPEEQATCPDRAVFDFCTCPHLQADYEKLPQEVQAILDEYVKKMPSKNDSSIASTTDESDFASASTSSDS